MNKKNKILVIASEEDVHADIVFNKLKQLGGDAIRIDPEQLFPGTFSLSYSTNYKKKSALIIDNEVIFHDDIQSLYSRDLIFPKCDEEDDISQHLLYAESASSLYGFFRTLKNRFWMNPPWEDEFADNKLYQQQEAFNFGFTIPETIITNDPEVFLEFYDYCNKDVIIKQLSEISLIDDGELSETDENFNLDAKVYGFYTSKVTNEMIENYKDIAATPCLFQKNIIKQADIRTTYVDGKCFSAKIDSQSNEKTKIDFRHIQDLPISKFDLPIEIEKKLSTMLDSWNIKFAACDFVLTPDNDLVFIEANVAGNWLWIEDALNMKISDEIAECLIKYN